MEAACSIDGCGRKARTRGWCPTHYTRWLKYGNPNTLLNSRHGHYKKRKRSREYTSWASMIARCHDEKSKIFNRYGGDGISVCDRWRNDFAAFFADMGSRPPNTSLDRFPDCNGDYKPGNCRWATPREQRLNQSRTKKVRRSDGAVFGSIVEAADATPTTDRHSIWNTCSGRQHSHRGFGWEWI